MCCCLIDNIFLMLMAGICVLIMYVDLMVLEKMFEEYFLLKHYLDANTYNNCYSPQTIMRMTFECYAVFCALCCTVLTFVLAFNVSEDIIKWVAGKVVNISFILFGPVLFTMCVTGFWNIRALSKVCGLKGIVPDQFNLVCVCLLVIFFGVSVGISYFMAQQKTMDMA